MNARPQMRTTTKWPKDQIQLTEEEIAISDDWMKYYFQINRGRFSRIIDFGHNYVIANSPSETRFTLEVGAGLGEHFEYEKLSPNQMNAYTCLELRENMAAALKEKWPIANVCVADCQKTIPFEDGYFDRIIAIHVLEHLPDLPAFLREAHRLLNPICGRFLAIIPCEKGLGYSFGRMLTTKRMFESRYKRSYGRFIAAEHVNTAKEILDEVKEVFDVASCSYYPLRVPFIDFNLCIGLTLSRKARQKP